MDAIQLLKEDHKKVVNLLDKINHTSEKAVKTRGELFSKVKEALEMHEMLEEKIFYPACKKYDEIRTFIFEAFEEHSVVDKVIDDLKHSAPNSEKWTGRFAVLKDSVTHHVKIEEGKLFPLVRKFMTKSQLETIGEKMECLKKKH
jgi:iron-sulfur cluster repair protein YtfE (RIC family)